LPVLLQQRDEEVDGKHDVGQSLVFSHLDVTDSNSQAKNLLQLELDGRLDFVDLLLQVLTVRDGGGELSSLGQTWSQKTRNLLDKGVGGEESVVLLGKLMRVKIIKSV